MSNTRTQKKLAKKMEALGPTRERLVKAGTLAQIETIVDEATGKATNERRVVVSDTCPLDRYHAKGKITHRQWTAGLWFAKAYYRAVLAGKASTLNYCRFVVQVRGSATATPDYYRDLMSVMLRAGLAHDQDGAKNFTVRGRVVRDVCGQDDYAYGSRLQTLKLGLDDLADALGYPSEKKP